MTTLAFVGTCQVRGMAAAAARWLPDVSVAAYPLGGETHESVAALLRGSDYVVTQVPDESGSPLSAAALAATGVKSLFMPPIVFTGFHPDMFYLVIGGEGVPGGISQYHSQIALAAYVLGIAPDRAARLYNAHVFAELGYFEAYAQELGTMTGTFARHGYDIQPLMQRLQQRRIVFMHTINHPTIFLLDRLAVLALRRFELVSGRVPPLGDLEDDLGTGVIGPIYQPIAARLGLTPQDCYLQPTDWVREGEQREMSIRAFVDAAYARYDRYDCAALRTPAAAPVMDRLAAITA